MRKRPLILLVDDEESFLEIASIKLKAYGFDTVPASGAHEGMRQAEALLPDFVLSDIFMPPGPSGWELALALRKHPKTSNIKFAFFTSVRDPWLELERDPHEVAAELGTVIFLDKDKDLSTLGERIKSLLKEKETDKP